MSRLTETEGIRNCTEDVNRQDGFWLHPGTLGYLAGEPQGFTTELLRCHHEATGRTVIFTLQTSSFSATANVGRTAGGATSRYDLRRRALAPFAFKVLVLGQLLTSGPYAHAGLTDLSPTEQISLQTSVTRTLLAADQSVSAVLLKDSCLTGGPVDEGLRAGGFYSLPVDPVMEFSIPSGWVTLEDYLAALTSKYRVRYRRARSKSEGIDQRPLSAADTKRYRAKIYQLYQTTSSGASYNAAELTEGYFPWLADSALLDTGRGSEYSTHLDGYFHKGELIGFTTAIKNGPVVHAHYLGLEPAYKQSHHIYHNMLYNLLERAIEFGVGKLDYGRTALEIKSSVGARPAQYACLLKARNSVINRLIPAFTPAVYAPTDWTPRNPFRH